MIMRVLFRVTALVLTIFLMNCTASRKLLPAPDKMIMNDDNTAYFEGLFSRHPELDSAAAHTKDWNIQIMYTMIDRDANNLPALTTYSYNVNNAYFYPASTIKLPVTLAALQKLHTLKKKGIDRNTTMITEPGPEGLTPVYNDPLTADGRATIGTYIKRIFLVSDNDAANRLYEFCGQQYINEQLHKKGYTEAQILHRVGIFLAEQQNRTTNPINFYDSGSHIVYSQPQQYNAAVYESRNE